MVNFVSENILRDCGTSSGEFIEVFKDMFPLLNNDKIDKIDEGAVQRCVTILIFFYHYIFFKNELQNLKNLR